MQKSIIANDIAIFSNFLILHNYILISQQTLRAQKLIMFFFSVDKNIVKYQTHCKETYQLSVNTDKILSDKVYTQYILQYVAGLSNFNKLYLRR